MIGRLFAFGFARSAAVVLVSAAAFGTVRPHLAGAFTASAAPTVSTTTADQLEALGYVEEVVDDPDPKRVGMTRHDPRAYRGVNYHCTGQLVRFIDMDGKVVHEMPLELAASGDAGCMAKTYRPGYMAVVRSPLLSLSSFRKGDRWARDDGLHHDVAIDARGRIYGFARRDAVIERNGRKLPVWEQSILVLDGKGRTERAIDFLPLFGSLVSGKRLDAIAHEQATRSPETRKRYLRTLDVFHPNSLAIVDWPHHGTPGTTKALIAIRDLDRIAVVDLDRRQLLWEWGAGEIVGPHDPWLLPDGNVLLFDNGNRPLEPVGRLHSRVVEVDPRSGKIVWQYPEKPNTQFFSPSRAGAQPLPNGNVLITETTKGHVFEVTREGEVVWDFWNPDFRAEDGLRRTIYRMRRMSMEDFELLRGAGRD